jgi:hypothetical protein
VKTKALVEVCAADGKVLGTCRKWVSSGLWRATGRSPTVYVGRQRRALVLGRGREARLVVQLEPGEAPPKDMEPLAQAGAA